MARVVVPFTPFSTKSARAAFALATCLAGFGPRRPTALTSSMSGRAGRVRRSGLGAANDFVVDHFHHVLDRNARGEHGPDRAVLVLRELHGLRHGLRIDG